MGVFDRAQFQEDLDFYIKRGDGDQRTDMPIEALAEIDCREKRISLLRRTILLPVNPNPNGKGNMVQRKAIDG
jgi:hypothetical protein